MTAVLAFLAAFAFRLSALYPSISPSNARYHAEIHAWRWSNGAWSDPLMPLLKLFAWMVPAGNTLFRVNLFSALLAGLTAVILVRFFMSFFPSPASSQMFVQMEDGRWRKACSWICGLAMVSSPLTADIFRSPDKNALTLILLLAVLVSVLDSARPRHAGIKIRHAAEGRLALLTGMGLGTSYYFVCFAPGLLDLYFSLSKEESHPRQKQSNPAKTWATHAAAFAAGFLVMRPSFMIEMLNLFSWQGLVGTLLSLSQGYSSIGRIARHSIHSLSGGFTSLGLILCLWGVYNLQKHNDQRSRALGLLILGAFVALPWATPTFVALFFGILAAYGIHDLGLRFFKRRSLGLAFLGLLIGLGLTSWDRQNLQARDLGLNAFQSLPTNAIFVPRTQSLREILEYAQNVLGLRRDVEIKQSNIASDEKALPGFLESLYSANPDRLIFFEPGIAVPGRDLLPYGLAFRYFPSLKHRLLNPPAQISLLRFTFWWYRQTAPWKLSFYRDIANRSIVQRYTDAHLALASKSREFNLSDFFHLENLAALSLSPQNYRTLTNLGEEALERKNYTRATLFFQDALKVDRSDAKLHFQLGQALQGAGRAMEALQAFKNAVDLAPDYRDARRNLAEAQDATRRHEEALSHWKWLMDQNPQDKDTVWRLIQDYHYTGRADKAKELLQEYFLMSLTPEEKSRAEIFYDVVMGRMTP